MKKLFKIVTTVALTSLLMACGGGSGGNSGSSGSATKTMTGKVIDGYVVGANIFVDINNNGVLDANEPSGVSVADGGYSVEMTEAQAQCVALVPTIVNVPVGAEDLDLGTVTEAYQMILPPTYDPLAAFANRHVTPLTSMLWDSVEQNLPETSKGLTCAQIQKDTAALQSAKLTLESSMASTSRRYNVSETELYSDFIATNNDELQSLAEEIVRGLQKSYADSLTLKAEHPNAEWAEIEYYIWDLYVYESENPVDPETIKAWFKRTYIRENNVTTRTHEHMSDDLNTVLYLTNYEKETSYSHGDVEYIEDYGIRSQYNPEIHDYNPFECDAKEILKVTDADKVQYVLYNNVFKDTIADYNECTLVDFTTETNSRYKMIDKVMVGDTEFMFQNLYDLDRINDLPSFFNMKDNVDNLDITALKQNFDNVVGRDFELNELSDAASVSKNKVFTDEDGVQVTLTKSIGPEPTVDGSFRILTTYYRHKSYPDFTHTTESSNDGVTWELIDGDVH